MVGCLYDTYTIVLPGKQKNRLLYYHHFKTIYHHRTDKFVWLLAKYQPTEISQFLELEQSLITQLRSWVQFPKKRNFLRLKQKDAKSYLRNKSTSSAGLLSIGKKKHFRMENIKLLNFCSNIYISVLR